MTKKIKKVSAEIAIILTITSLSYGINACREVIDSRSRNTKEDEDANPKYPPCNCPSYTKEDILRVSDGEYRERTKKSNPASLEISGENITLIHFSEPGESIQVRFMGSKKQPEI